MTITVVPSLTVVALLLVPSVIVTLAFAAIAGVLIDRPEKRRPRPIRLVVNAAPHPDFIAALVRQHHSRDTSSKETPTRHGN